MSPPPTVWSASERKPAFSLWGWAMLLVVLLCSAPTGGPPRTQIVGSAFDPATTSVVVKPSQFRLGQKAARQKLNDKPAELLAFVEPAISFPVFDRPLPATEFHTRRMFEENSPLRRWTRPLGTRAPPTA